MAASVASNWHDEPCVCAEAQDRHSTFDNSQHRSFRETIVRAKEHV